LDLSGCAIANGRDEGFTKLLFDGSPEAHGHGKILGGGIVGTHAGDMIGEIALAIEMGADAVDIGKTIHPHPTLGESIGMAAEVAHGSCTDFPPAKKQSPIRLTADAQLPNGPVLLVASTVRTRWAATVAAALLREHGASQVLVLALHLQP